MNILFFLIIGLITSFIFPPYFFLPLGFVTFSTLSFFFYNNYKNLKLIHYFFYGFLFGISFFSSYLLWIINPFFVFEETSNYFFISFLLIILLSIILGLNFILINYFNKPNIFVIPIVFTIFEFIISQIFTGFPWVCFSLIISNFYPGLILIKYFGSIPSTFIILLFFNLPLVFIIKELSSITKYSTLSVILIVPLLLLFNYLDINKSNVSKSVQIDIFQINKKINDIERNTKNLDYLKKLILKSDSEILVFGENNYPNLINDISNFELANILKDNQTLVIGSSRIENNKIYNSLISYNKNKISIFDKKILVPFGEYLPLRKYLYFMEEITGPSDFTTGNKERIIKINNNLTFIPIICYEITFYWKIINSSNYDSDFIINITNDYWFGNLLGPYQHFYITKLRATEFNKTIIRVSNNGISAILDSKGNIIQNTTLNDEQKITHNLTFTKTKSYFKFHQYIKILFLIIIILYFIICVIKNEKK